MRPLVNAVAQGQWGHSTVKGSGVATETGSPRVRHSKVIRGWRVAPFWVAFNFNTNTGAFRGVATLTAKGAVDGERFMFNLRDQFTAASENLKKLVSTQVGHHIQMPRRERPRNSPNLWGHARATGDQKLCPPYEKPREAFLRGIPPQAKPFPLIAIPTAFSVDA